MSKTKDEIQKEALHVILKKDRCGIAVSMGVGKTRIGLMHMQHNLTDISRFLVVAPKKSVFQSWKDEAKDAGMEHLIPHITFSTYLSLPKQNLDYDIIYLDECHNLLFSHEPWLDGYKGKILGLTGTPPRVSTSEKGEMVSRFCPIVYKYLTDQAVADKILNSYTIVMHPVVLDTAKNLRIEEKSGKVWFTSEESSYDYWTTRLEDATDGKSEHILRIMRMKSLMSFPSKERYALSLFRSISDKCILFANTHAQADKLCTHSYHSSNPQSEENLALFKEGKIMKLSSVLQLIEGINVPGLKQGIIMHAYGNERKSKQRIGRLLRLNPDDHATIHILYYQDTIDEVWARRALEDLDQNNIIWK